MTGRWQASARFARVLFGVLIWVLPVLGHAESVVYGVTFEGEWTTSATPGGVPGGAHFSPLIGAVHNSNATFWRSGGTASAGIESMAEVGGTATLEGEITAAGPDALSVIKRAGNIDPTETVTLASVTLTDAHPLVTLVTMVAPSPDWFVGVSGLSLMNDQGEWRTSYAVDLFPYDAGTEDGTEFSLGNDPTSPQGTITSIKGTGKFSGEAIATLTFTLRAAPTIVTESPIVVAENETSVATLVAEDSDTEAADLTWSIASGADAGKFALGAGTGVLAFAAAKDYESPDDADADGTYELTVEVTDGVSTATADLEVTVQNVLELATMITGPATVEFAENRALRVATYTASSSEDSVNVAWSLSGNDAGRFSIDTPGGALRFNRTQGLPDYETPTDTGQDNAYAVTVEAAASGTPVTLAVTVTVTDEDERGSATLSPLRPKLGEDLTASVSDADSASAVSWQWERSVGREGWEAIGGAALAAYTPAAADAGHYLRATATYTDGHGLNKNATATAPHVVLAHKLRSLAMATNGAGRAMYPSFDPETLHYAAECGSGTWALSLSAQDGATRLVVDGIQVANQGATVEISGPGRERDVDITLSGDAGASTTYVIHCFDDEFPSIRASKKAGAAGIMDDLVTFTYGFASVREQVRVGYLILVDNNGVPRVRKFIRDQLSPFHRTSDGQDRYAYFVPYAGPGWSGWQAVVRNRDFEKVAGEIGVLAPLTHTDPHDVILRPNGDYVLLSYTRASRDFSFLTEDYGLLKEDGTAWGVERVADSAFQIRTAEGTARFTWNSWVPMAVEDCMRHHFPDGYSHANSLAWIDGDVVLSFRGCSKVLRVDTDTGNVVWRVGRSTHSVEQWKAGRSSGTGPPALTIVNDPHGEFCGQHAAQILSNGNLLVYDNGVYCFVNPITGQNWRESNMFSRAVEYALDLDHDEAIFQRHHSLHSAFDRVGQATGHVEVLDNEDWLISWGSAWRNFPNVGTPPDHSATQVDPDTHEEKFALVVKENTTTDAVRAIRALPVSPAVLAAPILPLEAQIVEIAEFHTGTTDRPPVVVAFNQPVVDVPSATSSVNVTGVSSWSVAPHVEPGAPAHAYAFTLTPDGDGPISFELAGDEACSGGATGGICTARGALLSEAPAAAIIPGPAMVSLGSAVYSVSEGESLDVSVALNEAHGRSGVLTIPIDARAGGSASTADFTAAAGVTFGPSDTSQSLSVATHGDSLVEGAETLVLGIGSALPVGVVARGTVETTVTITDATDDAIRFGVGKTSVAEGNATDLEFSAGTGITFTTDQRLAFTIGGSAEATDYTVSAGGATLTAPYTLTLSAGENRVEAMLRVVDDASRESVETIVVGATHGGTSLGSQVITIPANDRDLPEITVEAATAGTPVEGAELEFTFRRTRSATSALTVDVRASETGEVLMANAPSQVTFAAGLSSASLTVPTSDDQVVEEGSEVTLTVGPSATDIYDVGNPQSASVTVADNDTATFEVTVVPERIEEGASAAVTIAVAGGVTFSTAQALGIELGGASPADYTVSAGGRTLDAPYGLTLPALASSVTATVNAVDDLDEEGAEALSVTATHGTERIGSGTLTIAASDRPARIGVVAQEAAVDEGEALAFTLTRTRVTEPDDLGPLTVAVTVSDGGGRLFGPAPSAVTFARGRSEALLRLDTNDDRVIAVHADERPVASDAVSVTVVADPDEPPAYVVAEQAGTARVAVLENDVAAFSLTVSPTRVAEGDTVAVSAAVGNGVTFSATQTVTLFAGEAGTAQSGADYGVFAPNQRERDHLRLQQGRDVATGTIRIEDDALSEGAETIRVVAAHAGVTFGAATIVIAANDGHAETRLAPVLEAVTVDGATVVVAYDRPLDEGSTPGAFSVRVDGVDRAVVSVRVEGPEVRLTLASPAAHGEAVAVSYMPGPDPIRDTHGNEAAAFADEVAFETLVSLGPAWASEGEALVFPVWLSRSVGGSVPVGWTVEPGSASAGVDYAGATSGTLTLGTAKPAGTIEVTTVEDAGFESDETFTVRLTEAVGFPAWAGLSDSVATGTIVNDDSAPPTTGGGGGGGGGSANHPPVVEREIDDQTLTVGEVLEVDIRLNFYDRDQRALDYSVASADASVAEVSVDRNGLVTIRGIARGVTEVTVTAADRREEQVSQSFQVRVSGPFLIPLFPAASSGAGEGFVRVINHSTDSGEVFIEAIDDAGTRLGPVRLSIDAGETVHFNSNDLEQGNASKGLTGGVGSGQGDWRLEVASEMAIEVLAYVRTPDGFLTSMHDTAPLQAGEHRVVIFNPGSNPNQVSRLRLVNPTRQEAAVTITGTDDGGATPGTAVLLTIAAGSTRTLEAAELEGGGEGLAGALGDGTGKWRLRLKSDQPLLVMSLLSSPTGHLTNLSTATGRRVRVAPSVQDP